MVLLQGDRHKLLQEVVVGEAEAVVEVGAVEVVAFEAGVVQEVAEVDLLEVAVVVDLGAEGGFRRTLCYIIGAFLFRSFHCKVQQTKSHLYLGTNLNVVNEAIFVAPLLVFF